MNKREEEILQQNICDWLKLAHPNIIFKIDLSGIKLTKGQGKKVSKTRSSSGFCDLDILQPNKNHHGLYIEFKKESPFLKSGGLKKMKKYRVVNGVKVEYDHLQEQMDMINRLLELGYFACFCWSFDVAKDIINNYINDII